MGPESRREMEWDGGTETAVTEPKWKRRGLQSTTPEGNQRTSLPRNLARTGNWRRLETLEQE